MLDLKEIKKNEIFYECAGGQNVKFIALEDAHRKEGDLQYWTFKGRWLKTGEIIEFGTREGYGYSPKLYKEPEYVNLKTWKAKID